MEKLLKLIENDATLSHKDLALMLSKEEGDISATQTRYICFHKCDISDDAICCPRATSF